MTALASLAPLDAFPAHDDPINHVAFAGDGRIMATSDTAMRVKLWLNRELLRTYDLRSISEKVRPTERIRDIRFTSDGNLLFVAAGEFVAAYRINSDNLEPEWTYIAPRLFAFLIVSPTSIAVSASDSVAAAFDNGTIAIWDAQGHRTALIRHNACPRYLHYLPDESVIGTDSFSVSLWRAGERRPVWHRPSRERIYGMDVSDDGCFVALRRLYTTTVYDVAEGAAVEDHKQGRGLPIVAFGPGTHTLAIGTQHAVTLHAITEGKQTRLSLEDAELISIAFLPDGSQVVAGCSDGCVRTWENPFPRVPVSNSS
jgi:WD40 repeat protein